MRYAALSPAMDEAALQRHAPGLAWRCAGPQEARRCDAAIAAADGVPASALRADFTHGRLQSLALRLPWWRHHAMARALVRTLGAPDAFEHPAAPGTLEAPDTPDAPDGQDAIVWRLPGGSLRLPAAPGLQPLRWVELRWSARPGPQAGMPATR